ncbi:hypothetical protein Pmani_035714 [Petrolisthes manimaculis]|uniref:Uncharacterized protein n=1 Tax=Petrolisthes manimaculis TaxID=1843537 RepID=A0AAE1NLP9_9EUCA|nr:hypothetical protein Pmani_035714 [Petrolisthes manimaculis]
MGGRQVCGNGRQAGVWEWEAGRWVGVAGRQAGEGGKQECYFEDMQVTDILDVKPTREAGWQEGYQTGKADTQPIR